MVEVVGIDQTLFRECSCIGCARRLRYNNSEIMEMRHTDYTGCTDVIHYIVCPVCLKHISVKKIYTSS